MTSRWRAGAGVVVLATAALLHQSTGTTYAIFHAGASANSTVSVATISAPTGLSGSCLLAVVTLTWTGAAGRVDGYQLRYSTDGTTYAPRGVNLLATATTTTDVQVVGSHWYRVRTVAGGFFADSDPVEVTCLSL